MMKSINITATNYLDNRMMGTVLGLQPTVTMARKRFMLVNVMLKRQHNMRLLLHASS